MPWDDRHEAKATMVPVEGLEVMLLSEEAEASKKESFFSADIGMEVSLLCQCDFKFGGSSLAGQRLA